MPLFFSAPSGLRAKPARAVSIGILPLVHRRPIPRERPGKLRWEASLAARFAAESDNLSAGRFPSLPGQSEHSPTVCVRASGVIDKSPVIFRDALSLRHDLQLRPRVETGHVPDHLGAPVTGNRARTPGANQPVSPLWDNDLFPGVFPGPKDI
jgi:hypothetical protein